MRRLRTARFLGILLVCVMLVSSFAAFPPTAKAATTIYVPDNYSTIQAAVDAASPGDSVIVRSGTYKENVIVNKSITLRGVDRNTTIIDATKIISGIDSGTGIRASSISIITGFTIINGCYGIECWEPISLTIDHNIFKNTRGTAIVMGDFSASVTITSNEFINNVHNCIFVLCSATVRNNKFNDNGDGIFNDPGGADACIHAGPSSPIVITGNEIRNNAAYGIMAGSSSSGCAVIIENNEIRNNAGDAIGLNAVSSPRIVNNMIDGNSIGIKDYGSLSSFIFNNTISNNQYGVYFQSSDVTIYMNNFSNNVNNVYSDFSTNTWNSPEEMTYIYNGKIYTSCPGNYWSDYTGSDAYGDGIGDTSYPVDSDRDNYPLMKPFENYSPIPTPDWRKDIQPGDILYDEITSFFSILVCKTISVGQHTGMYLGCGKTIEARLGHGVYYDDISSWDYPRRDRIYLLRVRCSEPIKNTAIQFAINQLGKHYNLSDLLAVNKNSSPNSPDWYCSELDWAAYYNQGSGINIESNATNSAQPEGWPPDADGKFNNAVLPHEIFGDEDIYKVGWHVPGQGEPYVVVFVLCPVNLIVTDPSGLSISQNSNQFTGAIYMQDDFNHDGSPDDLIYIPKVKAGIYSIQVIPEPGSSPNDTFSLEVSINGQSIVLANNVQLKDIPGEPYLVQVTESGQVFVITGMSSLPPPTTKLRVSPSIPLTISPPSLSLQYLNVNPQQAYAGQPVTVTTNLSNTGDEAGNYNVVLKINGQVEQQRMISVGPRSAYPVKFTITRSEPGTYTVDIGEQGGSFTVLGADNKAGSNGGNGLFIILTLGILAMIVVVMVMLYRRTG
jgi:parallel beta-helix repeat protein